MYGTVLSAIPDSGSNIYCNPIGEENERNRYMGCYHMGYVLGKWMDTISAGTWWSWYSDFWKKERDRT